MKVWVVMEQYRAHDDGNWQVELEAVHLSEAGANANLEPDYRKSGHVPGTRERYVAEMDALP